MKKRLLCLLLAVMAVLYITGCGNSAKDVENSIEEETENATDIDDISDMANNKLQSEAIKTPEQAPGCKTVVLANFNADGEPGQNASLLFADRVAEYSNGSLYVEVHNKSELGNAQEMAESVSTGQIEACLICEATLDKYDIRYALVPMPYLYDSYEHAYAVVDGPFRDWVNDGTLESMGLHNVGTWDYGFRNITNSKRSIVHPSDVAGLKLRTPYEVQLIYGLESMGAVVTQVSFSELLTCLDQKTVDGQENPISTIYNNALWDHNQHYLTMSKHSWEAMNLIVNNNFWNSLTDDERSAIERASKDAQASMREEVQSSEEEYVQKCREKGMDVVSEIDKEEFRASMTDAYSRMAEYVGDQAMVDKMFEIVDEVRESLENK